MEGWREVQVEWWKGEGLEEWRSGDRFNGELVLISKGCLQNLSPSLDNISAGPWRRSSLLSPKYNGDTSGTSTEFCSSCTVCIGHVLDPGLGLYSS